VTTITTMQLVRLTAAFLKAVSSFLHPATLQAITGSVTSGLYRQVDPTLMEIARILFMYEDSNERLSLRRAYIKNELRKQLSDEDAVGATGSPGVEWNERKPIHLDIFHQPALHSVQAEVAALDACLPSSPRQFPLS
jgi:hypothetical protein